MNVNILNKEVQEFITINLKSNITKLILKGSPFATISIQEIAEQIVSKSKCEKKLPTWFSTENIYYPTKLNVEQTSSEITAKYKSNLVSGKSLIDITGGFGVDAYYFSQKVSSVTHCEIDNDLSKIVSHNLYPLNCKNIIPYVGDGIDFLVKNNKIYDWIYADPSRRNNAKGKVFLFEDCLPDIPENLNLLFEKSNNILLKVAPLVDITYAVNELKFVKEIHIIAIENEVKELLFLLEKNHSQQIDIHTFNFNQEESQRFNFTLNEPIAATFSKPQKYLYEPNAAILKSGAFYQVSKKFKIDKLHQNSHLYTSKELIDFPGRKFEIKHCIPYNIKQLKKLIPSNKANITTRNFPETVVKIRKNTNIKDGGDHYLFFTTNYLGKHIILVCKKVKQGFNQTSSNF